MPTNQVHQVRIDEVPIEDCDDDDNPFVGPYRVFPGRLSVCRTFGDAEAKIPSLGGIEGCVTCMPEVISEPNASQTFDYIIIGSDGIYDKLKNDQIN
jgi:protein phosphatase 2C family protein 2/3